mmetsp:Transcript_27774/g.26828  ORF Transcript_27774/g.26828 Transcript_27774/m.26828 type:complete len:152 (-) Transcript_27774:45-500(-)
MQLPMEEDAFDKMMALNTKSIFFMIKECKELLKNSKQDPNILVISSASAKKPLIFFGVYAMAKAALENMVQWMALELADEGIRINSISPGLIPTKLASPLIDYMSGFENDYPFLFGEPEDIGGLAAAVCSKDGKFLNGEIVYPHGGYFGKL